MTTPMQKKYREVKADNPDHICLFRMGDWFETFGEDAQILADVCGLTLTNRDGSLKMAGFPCHRLEKYVRLLKINHKVHVEGGEQCGN